MKRIEKPSLEFLLGLKHGQKVNVSIDKTVCEAIVNANEMFEGEKAIFLCQNKKYGFDCTNRMGMANSWAVSSHIDIGGATDIDWIELLDEEPESLEDENNFAVIPTEETIVFDDYDMLAIWLIESNMK